MNKHLSLLFFRMQAVIMACVVVLAGAIGSAAQHQRAIHSVAPNASDPVAPRRILPAIPKGKDRVGAIESAAKSTVNDAEGSKNERVLAATIIVGPWVTEDIGDTALPGNVAYSNGTFTVSASGVDLYNTSDGFRYVYQPLNGDGEIIARVASVQNNYEWAQAGVMIRESLTATSRHASMLVTPSGRAKFRRRYATAGETTSDGPGAGNITIPQWVRLVRQGNAFSGYISTDGASWTPIGPQATPVTMATNVYVGMFVTSWTNTELNTSTLNNLLVINATSNPVDTTPPAVTVTAPANNATVSGSSVTVSANASDNVGITGVQFKVDGNNLGGEDTTAPYSVTWNSRGVANGNHILTAVARDSAGNTATSAELPVTTDNVPPPAASLSASPASITTGGFSTLSWTTNNATAVTIDQGIGAVAYNGSVTVTPNANTTYTLTATNGGGSITITAAVTVNPSTPLQTSDEFNGTALDQSWSYINPRGDSNYSLTATSGHLQLTAPGTLAHQCWGSKDPAVTCVRMTRPAANADAVYETRLTGSALTMGFMKYGIMLQQDGSNFMRFEFASLSASKVVAQGWNISNGNGSNTIAGPAVTLQAYNYLRLSKTGSKYRLEYGGDGVTWQLAGEILVPGFTVNQAGLFVSNSGNTPAVTASFDYWRVTLQSPYDNTAPTTPAGVSASAASANRINLSWQASTDDTAVTGYNVYRNGVFVGTTTTTSYADTSLVPATAYSYAIKAFDAAGNASGQSPAATAATAPLSSAAPAQLKILVWNIQQCETTAGVCDVNKQAQAMAQSNPDLILLSEVLEANVPEYISALNQYLPGVTWYQHFGRICPLATCNGGYGQGQLILSRVQPSSTAIKYFSGADRSAEAMVFNNLNGKKIAVVVTHLAANGWDAEDASSLRATEIDEMKTWARSLAPLQIIGGDFNTSPVRMYNGEPELNRMIMDGYTDAWQQAMNQGAASGYNDNLAGSDIRTLRARIDHMFYSSHPALNVLSATVVDSRDLANTNVAYKIDTPDDKAVKPSDHNKLEVILSVAGGATPTVNYFTASPTSISPAQSCTLSWATANATAVSIDQGVGSVPLSGSVTVWPATATTYTLTATNTEGSTTATAQVTITVPSAPTNLTAVASTTANQVTLSWSDTSNNESAFKIERCTGISCSNFSQINQVGANATSFTNTGLARNTNYRYRVRSSNSSGDSAYSNVVTIRTRP